jgi:ubiquinone/menaquinone biosynthesis C-methylase UbiE
MHTYDPFARYYDADFNDYVDDVHFYRQYAQRQGGAILELMCGTGRVLVPLAADGFTLTGVDSSPAMLARARERLAAQELTNATLIEGDVREVILPERHFGLAFVAINSFMHLEHVRDQLATLEIARKALNKRGLLVLDLFNPDPVQIMAEDNRLVLDRAYELDGKHVQKFVAIDSDISTQTSAVTYIYDETDKAGALTRRTMRFTMRWFYRYELEHLLARADFMLRAIYGSYDLDDYTSSSARLIVVASPVK